MQTVEVEIPSTPSSTASPSSTNEVDRMRGGLGEMPPGRRRGLRRGGNVVRPRRQLAA